VLVKGKAHVKSEEYKSCYRAVYNRRLSSALVVGITETGAGISSLIGGRYEDDATALERERRRLGCPN
jgi:hypothetical protein